MTVCPDCNSENNDEKCPKCNESGKVIMSKEDNWTCLTTVSNDIEFNIVKGLLETAGIPAVKKLEGIDGIVEIVTGIPLAGVKIWVPKDRYDEANQLLQASVIEEDDDIGR